MWALREHLTKRAKDKEEKEKGEEREQAKIQRQQDASYPAKNNWIVHTLCCFCNKDGPTDRTLSVDDLNYFSIELICLPREGREFNSTETGSSFKSMMIPHLEHYKMIEKAGKNTYRLTTRGIEGLRQLYSDHPELFSSAPILKDREHDDDNSPDPLILSQPDVGQIRDIEAHILNICQGSVPISAIFSKPSDSDSPDVETVPAQRFSLKARKRVLASGSPKNTEQVRGGFEVDKDSRAIKIEKSLYPHQIAKRKELLASRALIDDPDDGDYFLFAKKVFFESPSLAASVVRGTNNNGLINWKNEVTGRSLRETNEDTREQVQERAESLNTEQDLYELDRSEWERKAVDFASDPSKAESTRGLWRSVAKQWVKFSLENGVHPAERNEELVAQFLNAKKRSDNTKDQYRHILKSWFKTHNG